MNFFDSHRLHTAPTILLSLKHPRLTNHGIIKPVWVDAGVPTVRVKDMQRGIIIADGVA